jgi:hypothetical protein
MGLAALGGGGPQLSFFLAFVLHWDMSLFDRLAEYTLAYHPEFRTKPQG